MSTPPDCGGWPGHRQPAMQTPRLVALVRKIAGRPWPFVCHRPPFRTLAALDLQKLALAPCPGPFLSSPHWLCSSHPPWLVAPIQATTLIYLPLLLPCSQGCLSTVPPSATTAARQCKPLRAAVSLADYRIGEFPWKKAATGTYFWREADLDHLPPFFQKILG